MKKIKVGIIGAGWMGTTHARAYNNVQQHYGVEVVPVLEMIADTNGQLAKKVCAQYGFNKWSAVPEDVINDPDIEIVLITTPNQFHIPLVIDAAKAGKAIFCEKPLGMNGEDAKKGLDAVMQNGNISMVGFIYINNPMLVYAKELIKSGKLGEVVSFRGQYDMEYSASPDIPHTWRQFDPVSGALGDIGAHIMAISDYLLEDDIVDVCANTRILYTERPDLNDPSKMLPVKNDDEANVIYNYKSGAMGTLVTSRVSPGNKVGERFDVQLTKGAIRFDQERMNELEVYDHNADAKDQGFRIVRGMPEHGEYGIFCTQAGLGISYIDLMTIQAHKMLMAVAENRKVKPDIESGYKVNIYIDAMLKSADEHRWVKVSECEK